MAHLIEINNGKASFAENGRKRRAWHGLGQVFDGEMDVITALQASGADYTVDSIPAGYFQNDVWTEDPAHKYTRRADNGAVLGLVTKNYGIVQNREAFEFVNDLCCGGDRNAPFIEAAGVLGKGERCFVTAKFPERFQIGDTFDDHGEMYAVITTSHDGFGAVRVIMTPVRVVCNNTLQYAMLRNHVSTFSFKHTSGVSARMLENVAHAAQVLKVYDATLAAIKEQTALLTKSSVSERLIKQVCGKMAFERNYTTFCIEGAESSNLSTKAKNIYNGLRESIESGVGQDAFKKHDGNWLFNGLSSYFQNKATYGTAGQKDDPTRKFDNIFGGTVHKKLNAAYDEIVASASLKAA